MFFITMNSLGAFSWEDRILFSEVWRIFEISFTVFFIGEIIVKMRVFGAKDSMQCRHS